MEVVLISAAFLAAIGAGVFAWWAVIVARRVQRRQDTHEMDERMARARSYDA